MRKSREHVADNHGRTGGSVVVDRTGSVALVCLNTWEHFGSDILGGVTAVAGERMFRRNADIRVVSLAWKGALVYTWDVLEQDGGGGVGTCSSLVVGMP